MRETYLKREPMNNRSQTYDAIRKLLASLDDPFTRFLEPSRLAALRRGTAGAYSAVSAMLCAKVGVAMSGLCPQLTGVAFAARRVHH